MSNARTWWIAIAILVAMSSGSRGDPRRYGRDPGKVRVPTAPATLPRAPAPAPATPARAPTPAAVGADTILSIKGKTAPIRREQLRLLDEMIRDCGDCPDNEVADLHFRKAELYALEQQYYRLRAIELEIAANTAGARDNAAAAKKSLIEAVGVYKALVDNPRFRNYSEMPKALFYYGFMLGAGGYRKEMRDAFDRLLKEYPQSPYVPEAHLAFAEYHFENNQLADAENRYRRVLQFPKASVYWYAAYKLAWVELNRGRHQEALERFYDVAIGTRRDPARQLLHRAAKKDVVRAYAEVGNVHRARDFFRKLDTRGALGLYELYADLLFEQGKSDRAIVVYRDLIATTPGSASVCRWQLRVAESMLVVGRNPQKVEELDRLVRLQGVLARRRGLAAADLAECRDAAAAMAGDLARAWHQEWAKTRSLDSFALADRAYRIYLGAFAAAPEAPQTQYFHAELLWSRAEAETKTPRMASQLWEDAAAAFIAVVDAHKVDKKLLEESARAAVYATVNARTSDIRPQPAPITTTADKPVPRPIPPGDRKVLAVFDLYLASVRDSRDPEVVEMQLHKANLLRRYDHLAEALPILADIVTRHRDSAVAEDAVNFLLDGYNRLGRHDELVAQARQILADTKFLADRAPLKTRLAAIVVTHARKAAERLEADARKTGAPAELVKCGKAYAELYNRDTEAAGADELLYNAAVCFEDGKSVGLAIEMYKKLEAMGARAREDIRARAVARLGVAYGRVAYYDLASKYLELYSSKYAGVKGREGLVDAKDALSDAVVYRKGIGDDDRAIRDTLLFVSHRDARPAERAEAFFNLYAVYEKQGDPDRIVRHLREYIARHGDAGGASRLVQAYTRIGVALWAASCPVKAIDGSCIEVRRTRTLGRPRGQRRAAPGRTQCGPGAHVTVLARDARRAREAQAAFARAIAEYERRGGKLGGDERGALYWYAVARLNVLEPRFEAYLARTFPTNLDFDPRRPAVARRSLARFDRWLGGKDGAAEELAKAYHAVIALDDAPNAIAAAARIGQVAHDASDALFTAPIPASIRPYEEAVDRYCDTLTAKTERLEALTVDAFTACLRTSTDLGWFSEWSRLCERELGELQPGRYPATSERHAAPTGARVPIDVEPRTTRLGDV